LRVRVRDHLARIVTRAEALADELVETKTFRPGQVDRAIQRGSQRDLGQRLRHVVRGDGLEEHRRQTHPVAVAGVVGDPREELEELRGVQDRVRD
jgi:hypothetical protein